MTYQYQSRYKELIEPYKLGQISTKDFLANLSRLFDFMENMEVGKREALLIQAWNASIKLSETNRDRFSYLVSKASKEAPVFLISNTNELDVLAILNLLKQSNTDLEFIEDADISIEPSEEPVEILMNKVLISIPDKIASE